MNNIKLRKKLDEIIEKYHSEKVALQIQKIEKIKSKFAHNIKLVKEFNDSKINYNCFAYTFDLVDSNEYLNWSLRRISKIHPDSTFCQYLVLHHLTQIKNIKKKQGDYVIYFKKGYPSHSGKVRVDGVISKWGTGYLWCHDFYEVPFSYGNELRYYKKEDKSKLHDLYKYWALSKKS